MNQASSSSNMPRSTAEALKQIKKQGLLQKTGLSISIVNTDNPRSSFPSDSSVSKELRPKQNVPIDKTSKPLPRSPVTDIKSVLLQARSVPITTSVGQSTQQSNQAVYQESKININKSNQPLVSTSETTRAFGSQSWSNQSPGLTSENKPQGLSRSSQVISVVPENKNLSSTRLSQNSAAFTEDKIQTSRVSSIVHGNKTQSRMGQVQSGVESKTQGNQGRCQNQTLTFEGKVQTNHNRMSLNSPPSEIKVLTSNQGRANKNFSTVHENKSSTSQLSHSLAVNESKTFNNPQKVISRVVEMTSANMTQRNQVMKGMPGERNCQVANKSDRTTVDQSSGSSAMLTDRSVNNPFRVASTLPKKVSHTAEEKSLIKVTRVSQNLSVSSENQNTVHSKTSQSLTMQSESKAVSQVVKISSVSSDQSKKAAASFDNSNDCSPNPIIYTMSSRGTTKRPQAPKICYAPIGKKRCTKRLSPNVSDPSGKSQTSAETCNVSSDEGSSTKEKQFFNLKGLTPGLTITPVVSSATLSNPSTSGVHKKTSEETSIVVVCPSCKQFSSNPSTCDSCNARLTPNTLQFQKKSRAEVVPSFVVTKNVTTSIEKKIVYQFPEMMGQNQSFHFKQAVQGQVTIEGSPVIHVSPRGKGRPKARRKFVEPVCYTLSSDEEEPVPMSFNPILDEVSRSGSQFYPVESEGSKSDHSSASDILQDDNEEFDDPQFPGVTDINPHVEVDEEPEEIMDYDGDNLEEEEEECSAEDEEVEDEEESAHEEDPEVDEERLGQKPTDYPLRCRSIRIGSYKVHPKMNKSCVPVVLSADSLAFQAPVLTEPNKTALITLRDQDIKFVWVHFGKCLPIMFIFTTPTFGEAVRNILNMSEKDHRYFDPTSKDDKTQKLTFLIESITEDQRHFLRFFFPGDKKIKEMDQKTANEILVKSTPHQNLAVKLQCIQPVVPISVESQLPLTINTPSQITATKVILPQPVIKLFTYPPPPQTGGIAITNEDLACLNEGEFLNDAIIDFYLKYVFYEKLTPAQREKTHIFSSFFYPRLTHKPERPRSGEDAAKSMQARRHNQVKTWTRHVDIFSKDFIIIPVNQNVHWFLAIICYPGRVPDAPVDSVQPEAKTNKSPDNVTSTVEQEDTSKVIIKEISFNGEGDNSNQDENSMNSDSNSPYEVEEPPDSDEPSAETPDSTTHPDVKQRKDLNLSNLVIQVFPIPKENTFSQPCICIFDSLCGPNRWRIAATLREYLEMEWKMKKGTKKIIDRNTMQGFIMKCPQQTNYSDCGTYVLQYVESFFENPIACFRSPMPDLTNWFSEAKISKKRQQLQELILSLQKKLKTSAPSGSARKPNQSDSVPSSPATTLQTENR